MSIFTPSRSSQKIVSYYWKHIFSVTSRDLFEAASPVRGGIGSGVSYLYKVGGMLGPKFLWHLPKVATEYKNMIEIKKSPMASF